jgi:hypothetical protein
MGRLKCRLDLGIPGITAWVIAWVSGSAATRKGLTMSSVPNQYHVHGGGISVSYYPDGFGPPIGEHGRLILVYQDANRSLSFYGDQVRTVKVDDLGMILSVTIVESVDTGSTTFSLLVPYVQLPGQQSSVYICTEGITTIHRIFVALIGHPQSETYTVTALDGTAAFGELPG